jgi:hypothetical protein
MPISRLPACPPGRFVSPFRPPGALLKRNSLFPKEIIKFSLGDVDRPGAKSLDSG